MARVEPTSVIEQHCQAGVLLRLLCSILRTRTLPISLQNQRLLLLPVARISGWKGAVLPPFGIGIGLCFNSES